MSWRFAARLARREVRRRPGRTLLVTLLVAIPVFGMTVGAIAVRTDNDPFSERFRRRWGAADLVTETGTGASWTSDRSGVTEPDAGDVVRSVSSRRIDGRLRPSDSAFASTWVTVNEDPLSDSLLAGRYEMRSGRAPGRGEVAVSTALLAKLDLVVGERLQLDVPDLDAEIVGAVRVSDSFDDQIIVAPGFPFERATPDSVFRTRWYDLRPGIDAGAVAQRISERGTWASAETFDFNEWETDSEPTAVLAWGFVAGVIALAIVGIIVCAAFATSARRQLVTLGQLSANGAEARLLRRMLALQGTVSGVLGAGVGIWGALGALFLFRDVFERAIGNDPGPYVVRWSDLALIAGTGAIAATVAAAVPARSIVRVPVLAALGGRRPLGRLPRRLAPIGIALAAAGLGMLVLVALAGRQGAGEGNTPHALAAAAVVGGLLILAGVCCSSPVAVNLLTPIAARGGGTIRLAARSIARLRARSAAVVTAIAAAGIAATAAGTAVAMNPPQDDPHALARHLVIVQAYQSCDKICEDDFANPPAPRGYVTADHLASVAEIVPDIEFEAIRGGSFDPRAPGEDFYGHADRYGSEEVVITNPPAIADPWYLDHLELSSRDRATLRRDGVLAFSYSYSSNSGLESMTFVFPAETGDVRVHAVIAQERPRNLFGEVLMTPEFARSAGFELFESRYVGVAPADLSARQRDRLGALCCDHDESWRWDTSIRQPTPTNGTQLDLQFRYETWQPSRVLLDGFIIAVTLLLVGLVIAIGLSLSAVESRDERDTLTVLGARPRALRRLAALKAAVLVAAGGLLAIPAGFIPTWLVIAVSRTSFDDGSPRTVFDQFAFPWPTALGLVVVLPLIVGVGAWATSAIAQRFRPVRVSTMAFD